MTAIAVMTLGAANAQDIKNTIKFNPLALLGGNSDLLSYERAINDSQSIMLGAGTGGFKFGDYEYKNSGAELQYRFYFGDVLDSWYAGAQAGFTSGKVTYTTFDDNFDLASGEDKFSSIKLGGKFGHQWAFDSGFTIDLNIGAAYRNFNYKGGDDSSLDLKANGIVPTFAFALGYSF